MNPEELYDMALNAWGRDAQLFMVLEELSELSKAVCKMVRPGQSNKDELVDCIADAEVMMAQLKRMFNINESSIKEIVDAKLHRLEFLLEGENGSK